MLIKEPTVTYVPQKSQVEQVALAASICYNSKPKTGEDAVKFYNALISSGHVSCLRHASCYYIIPVEKDTEGLSFYLDAFYECPYIELLTDKDLMYVATNANFVYDCIKVEPWTADEFEKFKVSPEEFMATEIGHDMMRFSFIVETQISTTREFNRASPNNIEEQSTRYITMNGEDKRAIEPAIVRPHWMNFNDKIEDSFVRACNENDFTGWDLNGWVKHMRYYKACKDAFDTYIDFLNSGMKPEDARGVLPLDTYSKAIYTYSLKEWKHFLDLRLYDKTGKAHPNIKIIAQMIKNKLIELGYEV